MMGDFAEGSLSRPIMEIRWYGSCIITLSTHRFQGEKENRFGN